MVERIPTGIPGLDELLEGGFPKQRLILVSGATGTGKSIFGMQYVYKGLVEHEEPGIFVTFDEMPDKLREDVLRFGWNIKDMEKNELLGIVDGSSARAGAASDEPHSLMPNQLDVDRILLEIIALARRMNAKRLVIDSLASMGLRIDGDLEARKAVLKMSYVLARSGLTTILTTEVPEQAIGSGMRFSKYGVEEYVADGVILLSTMAIGSQVNRTIYIRKMRGTNHSMAIHSLEVSDRGIAIKKIEEVFK